MSLRDKITGRLKQAAGDLKGDAQLRAAGRREERKGEAKEELERANAEAEAKAQAVGALERLGGERVVVQVRVHRAEDDVVLQHELAVDRAGVDGQLAAGGRDA